MSKTAMQEFKVMFIEKMIAGNGFDIDFDYWLGKEKEQIETAYLAGWGNSSDYHAEHKEEITDEQYYTQTFTQ